MTAGDFGYALGTVLAGFLFMLPLCALSWVWIRFVGPRGANPWAFPLAGILVISSLGIYGATLDNHAAVEPVVIALGMIPSNIWCYFRFRKFRRMEEPRTAL
jgi:hypothetical protein